MGWPPHAVDQASFWEFLCAWNGWREANTVDDEPDYPTDADHERAVALVNGLA